jgi:hypothetical protein
LNATHETAIAAPTLRDKRGVLCCTDLTVKSEERGDTMSMASHLQELRKKHEHLSDLVEKEQRNPAADTLRVAEMKKQKLRLKEEITRLSD